MAKKPFIPMLLTVFFIAMGALNVLFSALFLGTELTEDLQLMISLTTIIGILYLVAGYGLYKGSARGWILATILTILSLIGSIVCENYPALAVHSVIFVLLLLAARHYGITIRKARPSIPFPSPATPVTTVQLPSRKSQIFVKRRKDLNSFY
ncbi:MAG: hypothetical protein DRN90_00255 [Thermoproteota archaeon]|nr:MAG: hypothetical protein DRN90_00255 [Candidatus Korarchaeota archaeon]